MITQSNPVRTCGGCNWYDSYPEDYNVGRCLLFDAVDPVKRNPFIGGVIPQDLCRYDLSSEEIEAGFTREEIAEIVNSVPETLLGKVTAEDINPILV